MTKRKTFRLSEQSRNSLKAELSKYKSGPPLGKIAKVYGVSLSTVNHHWGAIKKARKAKGKTKDVLLPVAPAMPKSVAQSIYVDRQRKLGVEPATPAAIHAEYDRLMANGHITVTIDQVWLKPIVEEVARTEVRDFLQTAFRK
jgi:hypothetical protein